MAVAARFQHIQGIMRDRRIYQFILPPNAAALPEQNNNAALMAALAVPPEQNNDDVLAPVPVPPKQNNDYVIAALMAALPVPTVPVLPEQNNANALLAAILAAMAKEEEKKEEKKEKDGFNRQIDCLGESNNPNRIGCV